jgi:hypothetical protein
MVMSEIFGAGTDPDDLAIALACLLRERGKHVHLDIRVKDGKTVAIEVVVNDGGQPIASFPCSPLETPAGYVGMLNASAGRKTAADEQAERALRAEQKWQEYERDYILPCFKWADEMGFDLQEAVLKNPGHNCVRRVTRKRSPRAWITFVRRSARRKHITW